MHSVYKYIECTFEKEVFMSKRKTNHMIVKRVTTMVGGIIYINKNTGRYHWNNDNFSRDIYNAVAYRGEGVAENINIVLKAPGTRIF